MFEMLFPAEGDLLAVVAHWSDDPLRSVPKQQAIVGQNLSSIPMLFDIGIGHWIENTCRYKFIMNIPIL